jgi:transposase InsO family protein
MSAQETRYPAEDVHTLSLEDHHNKFLINVTVNGKALKLTMDTGASVTLIGLKGYKEIGSPQLNPPNTKCSGYGSFNIPLKGWTMVNVKLGKKTRKLRLVVADNAEGANLFGMQWFNAFGLKITDGNKVPPELINFIEPIITSVITAPVNELCNKFSNLFSEGLGKSTNFKAHFHVKQDSVPKFFKPRPVPFAKREKVKQELERLVQAGVLTPVQTSDWAAPIVVVDKPNGDVRICGDYKVTANKCLNIEQYPLPRPEELFHQLRNGKHFTKIDLSDAYFQIELDDESKQYTVINTQNGLYQYNRLSFGIASAPAIFQRYLEQITSGLSGCANFLDDIIVTGETTEEHLQTLERLFERLEQNGLKCNKSKCAFFQSEVEYLGHIISEHGLRPSNSGIEAIKQLPRPKDLQQLQSFLGKINYYNKFIPNFSQLSAPLNMLRKKDVPFTWSDAQEKVFIKLKQEIIDTTKLVHFDQTRPLVLATDASAYGIGAVLSHRYPDGSEKPIAFASKTLTSAERNYSQIEKEGLAIIFGVRKFNQYLYGIAKPFELQTDHKPLVSIFSPDKGLPAFAMQRLQRWAIILMAYNFVIKYRPTEKHGNADALSRLPMGHDPVFDSSDDSCFSVSNDNDDTLADLPIDANKIRAETLKDNLLTKVRKFVENGWPESISKKQHELKPFFDRQLNLSIHKGVLLWQAEANRVIIPSKLQKEVLCLLHHGHFGIVRMKQLARQHCWWPSINSDIHNVTKTCAGCLANQNSPPQKYKSWPVSQRPWERIHIDFAGPFMNQTWLIAVDSFSKFPFICNMNSLSTEATIRSLSKIFVIEGLPETIVSDNGPQFTSDQFVKFCTSHGISHLTTAPFHPASNGEAERFVRTFKTAMKKICYNGQSVIRALDEFLFAYRTTPNPDTGKSPAELLHGRQPRTQLSLLLPSEEDYDRRYVRNTKFNIGDSVSYKNFSVRSDRWLHGTIVSINGNMMYTIETDTKHIVRRHQNQIRLKKTLTYKSHNPDLCYDDFFIK